MPKTRRAALSSIGAFALAVALFASPASATGDRDHDRDGDGDRSRATSYTEDDDTNDDGTANNVRDDGDDRHPSGRDRSVERGGSDNQGRSESDPDDDGRGPDRSNGGPDKPNGSGGVDQADQDGNNGCGNDDDFEDDNEGWCGNKPDHDTASPVSVEKPEHETDNRTADRCERDADHADHADDADESDDTDDAAVTDDADESDDDADDTSVAPVSADKPEHEHETDIRSADRCERDADDADKPDYAEDDADDAAVTDDADEDADDTDTVAVTTDAPDVVTEVLPMEAEQATTVAAAGAEVMSVELAAASVVPAAVAADTNDGVFASVAAGALAFTGDHIMLMVIAALIALAIGFTMVRSTKRSRIQA